jgi:hypothetical protein
MAKETSDMDELAESIERLLTLGAVSDLRIKAGGPVELTLSLPQERLKSDPLRRVIAALADRPV